MRILLTGGEGQVGIEIRRFAWPAGVEVVAPARAALDLARPESIEAAVERGRWDAVINCAAYTAVDRAEADVASAWAANALGPAVLAYAAARRELPIVHVSTDYVFDGAKHAPYEEDDAVAPINVYGASKEGGEQAVRTANQRHVILRTAWVVSPHRSNFVKTMLREGARRPKLRVVDDQRGCPTGAADIAAAIAAVALQLGEGRSTAFGTYHFVNAGETTWHGLAAEVFEQAGRRGHPVPELEAISTADYPTPARRPANSRLATRRVADAFGIAPRPWGEALAEIVDELVPRSIDAPGPPS